MQQTEGDRTTRLWKQLQKRKQKQQYRQLQPVGAEGGKHHLTVGDQKVLNFCSNDYLGLSTHPELIHRSNLYTKYYGTSSSASRLVSGSLLIHHDLEDKIAGLYKREASLLFGSGFQANVSLLPAITQRADLILADKRSHNSILQGCMLSRAEFRRFRHNDAGHLETLLKRYRSKSAQGECWVVTESLFSMDGDRAPLKKIQSLCRKYGACLMVDDAHAFGVWGEKGLGYAATYEGVDIILGTLGKAGGGYGAFVVCSNTYKEYLINYCSGVIYSTSPPPGVIGAADAAFDLIPNLGEKRNRLKKNIDTVLEQLRFSGFDTGPGRSQIIPVLLQDEEEALKLSELMKNKNLFVQAIRPPTVERSRLRITVTADHTSEDLRILTKLLSEFHG